VDETFNTIQLEQTGNAALAAVQVAGGATYTHVQITNNSATSVILLKTVNLGDAAPVFTSATADLRVAPGDMVILPYGSGLDLYLQGAAGGEPYVVKAFMRDR
jgi:hypothetical protein